MFSNLKILNWNQTSLIKMQNITELLTQQTVKTIILNVSRMLFTMIMFISESLSYETLEANNMLNKTQHFSQVCFDDKLYKNTLKGEERPNVCKVYVSTTFILFSFQSSCLQSKCIKKIEVWKIKVSDFCCKWETFLWLSERDSW